uniref:hypothetical protein n=1 Tax=Candidatus Electrothrix sp. TaxID=2170559 RepID=UPI00405692FC
MKDFAGENVFCRATNAIRLNERSGIISNCDGSNTEKYQCVFRRFFFEGRSVGKIEVGFRYLTNSIATPEFWPFCIRTIAQSQWIVGPRHRDFHYLSPLVSAGDAITKLYLRSTTTTNLLDSEIREWWVDHGEPVVVLKYDADRFPPPQNSVLVPLSTHKAVELYYQRVFVSGKKLNVWYIGVRLIDPRKLRQLRLHLLRFHAEIQSLKIILRHIMDDRIQIMRNTPASDELQAFLRDAIRLISKNKRYGIDQRSVLDAVRSYFDFVSAGERKSLLFKLKQIRRNILRSLEAQMTTGPSTSQQLIVLGNAQFLTAKEIKNQGATMTKFDIKFGDYATVNGDFVVAQSIQDSFNTLQDSTAHVDLKEKLETLTKEVTEQLPLLPQEVARQLADDLNIFVKESIKPTPRKKWYELSAKGIMDAAKALGGASGKIIGLVKDLLSLLSNS